MVVIILCGFLLKVLHYASGKRFICVENFPFLMTLSAKEIGQAFFEEVFPVRLFIVFQALLDECVKSILEMVWIHFSWHLLFKCSTSFVVVEHDSSGVSAWL